MPYHVLLDTAGEARLGSRTIGTTKRGIGPCYADKSARLGIRVQDLLDEKILRKKIMAAMEPKRQLLRPHAKDPELDLHSMTEEYVTYGHRLEPYIADTARLCWDAARRRPLGPLRGRPGNAARPRPRHLSVRHLLEPDRRLGLRRRRRRADRHRRRLGDHQGLLDPGRRRARSRPSSRTSTGERLRESGGEFGTTTGRPRRCGWLDLVALRYAVRLNGMTGLVITKLDVLTGIDPLRVAVRYRHPRGRRVRRRSPTTSPSSTGRRPSTRSCPASTRTSAGAAAESDLPAAARDYLDYIADFVGVPITLVGVGPGREQVIWVARARTRRSAPPDMTEESMKFVYKPFALIVGLLAGMLSKKVFEKVWGAIADEDPSTPTTATRPGRRC